MRCLGVQRYESGGKNKRIQITTCFSELENFLGLIEEVIVFGKN